MLNLSVSVSTSCRTASTASAPAPPPPPPESAADGEEDPRAGRVEHESRTTVMLRYVPPAVTRARFLGCLDHAGFAGRYDFVYLPVDFTYGVGLGYALVGFSAPQDAQRLVHELQGFSFGEGPDGGPRCEASWSEPPRTLAEHIERYRNSPVMHPTMPEEYKPVLFKNGVRQEFPPPTRALRLPRIRHPKAVSDKPNSEAELTHVEADPFEARRSPAACAH
mmetsp:Transcript_30365/g.85649  ORF Transcript_30365/g.85649 Transcript_30365/m.85649 type:complete len:221 (-) Transcript_30365:147-809(-)